LSRHAKTVGHIHHLYLNFPLKGGIDSGHWHCSDERGYFSLLPSIRFPSWIQGMRKVSSKKIQGELFIDELRESLSMYRWWRENGAQQNL